MARHSQYHLQKIAFTIVFKVYYYDSSPSWCTIKLGSNSQTARLIDGWWVATFYHVPYGEARFEISASGGKYDSLDFIVTKDATFTLTAP